jgi:pyruvate dehydrogenase E1 component alpha subunit
MRSKRIEYKFLPHDQKAVIQELGKEKLLNALDWMLKIRNFEVRAESAYQQGMVGGFFHSYIGQEAIQTASLAAFGEDNWWATTYRCHALALLLRATPNELMAELYGRATGNAKGRGGSMHLYTDKLLGGFGIVGGQVPIATGAAFTIKYLNQKDKIAVCYLGDGAVAQGAFHEALNMAALWDLPCIYIIENNQWGMGTHFQRAISVDLLAEDKAPGYGMEGYTLDGMDFFNCYSGFKMMHEKIIKTQRPILVEVVSERFRGHSISDPGLYRSKDELKSRMESDPIQILKQALIEAGIVTEDSYKELDKKYRQMMIEAMKYAEESPWPDPKTLEQDVFAP